MPLDVEANSSGGESSKHDLPVYGDSQWSRKTKYIHLYTEITQSSTD